MNLDKLKAPEFIHWRAQGARDSRKEVIIVTGGSGFIASTIINKLAEKHRMVGLDLEGEPYPPITAESVDVDVGSAKSIEEALKRIRYGYGKKIAAVIHLAAHYDFSGKPSPLYNEVTVQGTKKLLQALQEFDVGQFIFSSSLLVYAPSAPGHKITEDSPLDPKWDYPLSKVKAEKIIHEERDDIPVVILRIAGVYSDTGNSIPLANQIQRIYEKQLTSHFFPGDATHGNPFVHIDDLAEAISKAVEKRDTLPPEVVINIGEPETLSFEYLQKAIGKLIHDKDWKTRRIPKYLAKAGAWMEDLVSDPFIKPWMIDMADDHMELDITKAKTLLGWEPKHFLRDTLPKIIAALNANPQKWYRENKLKPHGKDKTVTPETNKELDNGSVNLLNHKAHHRKIVWMHYMNFFLGVWLLTSPFTFNYGSQQMAINDMICGALVCAFSLFAVNPMRLWAPWGVAFTGLWLSVAPLVFWAPEAVSYHSDTIVGILLIAFALVAPGVPGIKLYEKPGPYVPPGWSYNPSAWSQRAPIIFLGWIGFFAARYLTAYQLGYIDEAKDPYFGKGTENVLNSDVSKAWPVSDAGLGAFSYMLDAMIGYIGTENRWRTMPWVVIFFGILIIPLGAISITLIILQPIAVGSWCSVCLFTAMVMLIMIPCTFDEVFASLLFLRKSQKEGKSLWKTFWLGGTTTEKSLEVASHDFTMPLHKTLKEIFSGIQIPWNLGIASAIGIWLMFAPAIFGYGNAMADSDHLVGALVVTFSVIAMGEIVRTVRFVNILFGLWLMLAPFILGVSTEPAMYNSIACGILLILLSLRKGRITNNYGSFNKYIV